MFAWSATGRLIASRDSATWNLTLRRTLFKLWSITACFVRGKTFALTSQKDGRTITEEATEVAVVVIGAGAVDEAASEEEAVEADMTVSFFAFLTLFVER